jgi:CTP:molybdopterin cytidylyltransferase MocA
MKSSFRPPTAGLVLAAGAGRRYGMPKALVHHDGRLLVERAITLLRRAGCAPVVVVLGAASAQVQARADLDGVTVVENPAWQTGMGSSLRAGLAALTRTEATTTIVLLVDMPGITVEAVRRVAAGAGPANLVVAGYDDGRTGHPVLLGRDHWAGVARSAVGDTGARAYLRAHRAAVRLVPCADVADDGDLDRMPHA